jgi:hypothetical protein
MHREIHFIKSIHCIPNYITDAFYSFAFHKNNVVVQLVEALHYKPKGCGFDSPLGSLGYCIDLILPATL